MKASDKQPQEGSLSASRQQNLAHTSGDRVEKITQIGAVVSAIVASSCCWLPLLLVAVGISGAGIAATLEAYRPWFIAVTFALLAVAFYLTYRPRKTSAAGGHNCCDADSAEPPDACCTVPGKGHARPTAWNKRMLWVVTALAIAFVLWPYYGGLLLGTSERNSRAAITKQLVLRIDGMSCQGCAATVSAALRSVPGVRTVEVHYEQGEAVVGLDPCCSVPTGELLQAVQKAGYSGSVVSPLPPNSSASGGP
jgi:copper chaperone CopZ